MPISETKRESVFEKTAANSTVLTGKHFIKMSSGFASIATAATDRIIGVNENVATFASDNQTVAKKTIKIVPKSSQRLYEVAISGGAVTSADEGKFFNLLSADTVSGASVSLVPFYSNTSDAGVAVDPVISMQLELTDFVSATLGRFRIVNL